MACGCVHTAVGPGEGDVAVTDPTRKRATAWLIASLLLHQARPWATVASSAQASTQVTKEKSGCWTRRRAFAHPWGRALSRGVERSGPGLEPWVVGLVVGAGSWLRGPGQQVGVGSHAPIRAQDRVWVRMTVSPDPGCSVRSTAVLRAHAQPRAHPVLAFSGADSSWVRTWKQRASSRRAIATVATWLPRRRANWA